MPFDLGKFLKLAGAVAGAVAGLTLLAFMAGFMAQRAQFQFAQVPFVFYDYGAYVETGVMAALRSVYLLLGGPWPIILLATISIAVVLLLEFEWFRKLTVRPYLAFGIYVLVIASSSVVLQQQFAVSDLAQAVGPSPLSADSTGSMSDDKTISPPDFVPLEWPFDLLVSEPKQVNLDKLLEFPCFRTEVTSDELWRRLAEEIDGTKSVGSRYLELRPNPDWALAKPKRSDENVSVGPLLGFHVEERDLENSRSLELYRLLTVAILICIWAVGLLALWQRRLQDYMANSTPPNPSPAGGVFERIEVLLVRFQEELWFSAQWILRPITFLLVGAQLAVLPECFGILAMPRLGQEYVEVATVRTDADGDQKSGAAVSNESHSDWLTGEVRRITIAITDESPTAPLNRVNQLEKELQDVLYEFRKLDGPTATRKLKPLWDYHQTISPKLARMTFDAYTRASDNTSSGFLLHYPRSDKDQLSLLDHDSTGRRWSIRRVSVSEKNKIVINSDQKSVSVLGDLNGVRKLSGENRVLAVKELFYQGHPNMLEIAMAGAYDCNSKVAELATNAVGRYAAGLSESQFDKARKARAERLLLNLVWATDRNAGPRGEAAKSLCFFVRKGDEEVSSSLRKFIQARDSEVNDPDWVVRDAVITTIGNLRVVEAVDDLTSYLHPESTVSVPERGLASILSALTTMGGREKSVPALVRVVRSDESPDDRLKTAITALGLLPQHDNQFAIDALGMFLAREEHPKVTSERLSEELQPAAVDALRNLGDRYAIDYLTPLISSGSERSDAIRLRAIVALGELRDTESQGRLLELCESDSESNEIRVASLIALAKFGDDSAIHRVYQLSQRPLADRDLIMACLEFFNGRASAGSSEAANYAKELRDKLEHSPSRDFSEKSTSEDSDFLELLKRIMEESPDKDMVESLRTPDGKLIRKGSRVTVAKPGDENQGPGWVSDMAQYLESPLTVSELYKVGDEEFFDVEETIYTWDVRWIVNVLDVSAG